jgi:hypothetical protein
VRRIWRRKDSPETTMMNAEAATSENTAAVAEQGATVAPEKASWKKGASPKQGAPKGQKQRPSIPRFRHHHSGVIERADPAKKLRTVLVWGTSTAFLSRFQLNDVMNFIPPFARRLEPGQNHPDHTIFDFDNITDFELRFVRAAYKSLAWCVLHPPILTQHE